jgi:hypothetical protein
MNKDQIELKESGNYRGCSSHLFVETFNFMNYECIVRTTFPHNITKTTSKEVGTYVVYPTKELLEVIKVIPNCFYEQDPYSDFTQGYVTWNNVTEKSKTKWWETTEIVEDSLDIFLRTFPIIEPIYKDARLKLFETYYPDFLEQFKTGEIK